MEGKVEEIIAPVKRDLIENELKALGVARTTRKGDNEIYILNHHNSPNTMREIGRLRELSFRSAGGGTKKSLDIDHYDTCENGYQQLIVWSPEDKEIIGGYRFIDCQTVIEQRNENGAIPISTAHYFHLSDKFIKEYLPNTIELGRSWVQPNYQPTVNPRKGLYALDNIWDGLAVLTVKYPNLKYFFGKVTMYPNYHVSSRDHLLAFLKYYFPDKENLAHPIHALVLETDTSGFMQTLKGKDFKDGFKELNQMIRSNGENIPPLMNIYMNLSPTMKTFGTAVNPDFGGVEETAILVTIADIYEDKKERHIAPLLKQ
ncbi:MAG: GNAT family N-acetyltransferase [Crocinitomicaceae bacterium]|nr:GNAT family N-acetyltransferase [Crocinitomicaceae bacterium]